MDGKLNPYNHPYKPSYNPTTSGSSGIALIINSLLSDLQPDYYMNS